MDEAEAPVWPCQKAMNLEEKQTLKARLGQVRAICRRCGLVTSVRLLDVKMEHLPKSSGEMDLLMLAIQSKFETRLFFQMDLSRRGSQSTY